MAQSDENKYYVYLSDGGHFENLAVYELIKRHCKVIVACDADCDGKYDFENLLALIEKARSDFGARIAIDFSKIRPPKDGRESKYNFAVGDIFYDPQNPNDRGKLFYIKASLPRQAGQETPSTGIRFRMTSGATPKSTRHFPIRPRPTSGLMNCSLRAIAP